jgi:hypothetical protein
MLKATHDEIAERAYAIWEREGRPHGRDLEHWLTAEYLAWTESQPARASTFSVPREDLAALNRRASRRRSARQASE